MGLDKLETLTGGPCFQVFSTVHGPRAFVTFPWRLYNHFNHSHAPGPPAHVAESGPLALLQVLQNSGNWMLCVKHRQREITTDEIQENKIESAAILKERLCQCTDGLSATQNSSENNTIRELNPSSPTHCDSL